MLAVMVVGMVLYGVVTGEYSDYRVRFLCPTEEDAQACERVVRAEEKDEYRVDWEPFVVLASGQRPAMIDTFDAYIRGGENRWDEPWPSEVPDGPHLWRRWDFEVPEIVAGKVIASVWTVTNDRKGVNDLRLTGPTPAAVMAVGQMLIENHANGTHPAYLLKDDDRRFSTTVWEAPA